MNKRKRGESTGIIAAWELFWDAMEDIGNLIPDQSTISMFRTTDTKEVDHFVVQRALELQTPDAVMRDLESICTDALELQYMLTSFADKDSFMRVLLRNESIQSPLLGMLLDLLHEYAQKVGDESESLVVAPRIPSTAICNLILRHIRWVECIYDTSALTEKLVSSLPIYPMFLQKDVIHILPELVADADVQVAIDLLLETISSESELVIAAVDALANFNTPMSISEEVTSCIISRLPSAPIGDMPALIRFLLQSATDQNASAILNEIREKVSVCVTSQSNPDDEGTLSQQFLQDMSYRSDLMTTYLKIIAKSTIHNLLDVWSLVGFYSLTQVKPKSESLFVKKVGSGQFSKELLHCALVTHLGGVKNYTKSIVQLAGSLLQSSDSHSRDTAKSIFVGLFNELSKKLDNSYDFATQIVSDLISYCYSSTGSTVNSALATLLAMTEENIHQLDKYMTMLRQLMDAIEKYTVEQCRQVYRLLFRVGGSADQELSITIRKQLYHQDSHYRKLGMIGYICCLEEEIQTNSQESTILEESENPVMDAFEKKLRDRLDVLRDACRRQPRSLMFMFAELKHLVNRIPFHANILHLLEEKYSELLTIEFLPAYDPQVQQNGGYKLPFYNNAFQSDQWNSSRITSPVYLQLMTLISSPATHENPLYLFELLSLVVSCNKRLDSLDNIGIVLICPMLLMSKSAIPELGCMESNAQDAILFAIWSAVNWCRELLNCFSSDTSLTGKVLLRLENTVEFENMLEDALTNIPSSCWVPPGVDLAHVTTDSKKESKGKGKVAQNQVALRMKSIRKSYISLHPGVINILPHDKDSIDPDSFLFLLDHFHCHLKKALTKPPSFPLHWISKPTNRLKPNLVHVQGDQLEGFELFDTHLKFQLFNIANNMRWVMEDMELPKPITMRRLCMKYLQCVSVLATTEVFTQQNNPLLQVKALQQFLLPGEMHQNFDDIRQTQPIFQSMCDTLLEFQHMHYLDIELAVELIRALQGIEDLKTRCSGQKIQAILFSPPVEGTNLSNLALTYLQKNWSSGSDKFTYKSSYLSVLLEAYFQYTPHPLDSIQELTTNGFVDLMENIRSTHSNNYPTLSKLDSVFKPSNPHVAKKTVGLYLRVCFETLVRVTSRIDISNKNKPTHLLHYLLQASLLFKLLVGLTRSFQASMVVASVLKHGSGYIQNILRYMPYFETHFVQQNPRIMQIFKEVQSGTRKLQILCAHGKLTQDASAASQVPKLKKLLEQLIYKSAKLARENNVLDAFTTGILKQRNLDGSAAQPLEEDSSSQETEVEDTQEQSE